MSFETRYVLDRRSTHTTTDAMMSNNALDGSGMLVSDNELLPDVLPKLVTQKS